MKKIVSLLCAAAMLVGSLAFVGCQNGASANANNSGSVKAAGTGVVMGYVLDNRGEPVEGATVTLGGSSTTTNAGGEFVLTDVAVNTTNVGTATNPVQYTFSYAVTAKKDGYLSAVIPAIAVTYDQKADAGTAAWQTALGTLGGQYKDILLKYAEQAGLRSTTTTVLDNGTNSNNQAGTGTSNVGNDTANNTVVTVNDGSGKDDVMKILANALKDLENLTKDQNYFTQFYSTFGKAVLIPCDATLKGKVRLTTSTEKGSFISEDKIFVPTSKPTVRVSYTADNTAIAGETPKVAANDYTWKAEVDDKGFFTFEKLPSGVDLSITIDSFYETISDVEYVFSSASSKIIAENSGAEDNGATKKVKLGSGDANVETYSYLLYAQNDKLWITASNLGTNTDAALIKTTDPIEFTFNKEILKASLTADGGLTEDLGTTGQNAKKGHGYTAKIEGKKVTFTPDDGNWTGSGKIKVVAEAKDGATTILNAEWNVALDENTWISLEGVNYGDNAGLLSLSSPIVLKFTRPMTENVTFTLSSTNEYTRTWSEDKTVLTLNPSADAKYWKVGYDTTAKAGKLTITSLKAEAVDGTKTVAFWKNGAKDDGSELTVYFDTFVDVTVAKADVTGHEAFTITFSKALKSIDVKDTADLMIQNADASKTLVLNKDYTVAIDADKKVITVTSKEAQFPYEGKYKITLNKNLKAFDGSAAFREAGDKAAITTTNGIVFTTDFSFEGLTFKPVSIEVIDSLPATAVESRASIVVTTDKVLKFTFNKEVKESKITITTNSVAATTKNYIDSADAKVVYVPLETVKNTTYDIVLGGTVDAKDDVVTGTAPNQVHSDQAVFNATNIAKWFNNTPDTYTVYAALNLTATSLIKGLDHVTGKPEYSVADPIAAGAPVTFTFDKKLDNEGDVYTASYKIFGKKDVNDANAKIELLVENGTAAVSGNTVTVTDATFKTKKVVGDAAEYYLELRVNNAKGVKVFSTTSPYFGSIANTLEAYAKDNVYDAPATSNPDSTPNNNSNYGSFKIKVAEKNHLTATSLIDETKYSLTKSSYKAAKAIAAKSAITFTFDSLPEGATASYELYDNNTASAKVITSGAATIVDKVVTVKSDLLVSGNPKVDGKTFDVKEKLDNGAHTGIYIYYLKLEVKDKNGNVLFSTANKLLQPATTDKRTDFEKAVYGISAKSNGATDTDLFTVEVAPLAVEALSWLPEKKDSFGVTELNSGNKVYDAKTIDPKAAVTITFNAAIPAGAKYSYKISDSTGVIDKTESAKAIDAASNTITIQSNKMTATTDVAATYYIDLSIMNGNDKLFGTDSDHFGNATDFEKAAVKADDIINKTKKAFQVKVTKTQIVKSGDKINGVESKTTSDDDKGFQKTFKSPIVLQFTHPVTGYKAVIYKKTAKLYTDADVSKTHALTSFTEYKTTYDDFVKESAEYIYASTAAVDATNAKLLTITPTNYFKPGEDVNIAIFNDEGKYVAVKDTTSDTYTSAKDVTFTAKANATPGTSHEADEKLANEMLAAAGELAVATPKDGDKLGNGQSIILSVPTTYSTTSKSLPTYKLFLKKAEETGYKWVNTVTPVDAKANGAAISTVNYLLGRAPTSFFAQILDNDACDYYNSTTPKYAGYVLIKELDGVLTAYKTAADAIKDEVGPKVSMANLAFTSGGTAFGTLASTSTSIAFELSGTGAPNISNTGTPTASAAAITGGFVMKITSAEVVKLADIKYVGKANASAAAEPKSSLPTTAHVAFDGDSKVITVTFKSDVVTDGGKAYLYEGDTINIKLTDVSGAEATYTVTIKQ